MSKLSTTIAFLAGVAIGGVGAWYYTKEKYARLSEREIDSVKETFAKREQKLKEKTATAGSTPVPTAAVKVPPKESITEYTRRVRGREGFTSYSKTVTPQAKPELKPPYVISPEEFGEIDDYTQISLTYFDDGILSDENGIIIDDAEEIIGDALEHFGEYEEDSVFVRSDTKRCDYEILRDLRSYAEFRASLPPKI